MFVLLALLSLASLFCLFLGLIKPTLVLRWGAKRTRLRAIGWYWLFTVVFAVLAGAIAPNPPLPPQTAASLESPSVPKEISTNEATADLVKQNADTKTKETDNKTIRINVGDNQEEPPKQNSSEEVQKREKDKNIDNASFDFDIKTFIKRYNNSAKKLGQSSISKSKSSEKDDKTGKVHTLIASKDTGFTVVTNSNGLVKESIMIGSGDGTPASGMRIILGIASFFDVFDPKITGNGRGEILRGLGILDGAIPETSSFTRGNVKYTLVNTKGVGIWLVAEPAI